MRDEQIRPEKVTKPIQLLAAWLAGMILINSAFLTAARAIQKPEWAAGVLVIAAIVNVPLFLLALFLLQTKFRPEMQEDVYYSKHLERVYSLQTRQTELIELEKGGSPTVARSRRPRPVLIEPSSKISIEINDLLPRYQELVAALAKRGIIPTKTFGSINGNSEPPKRFVIAVGPGVPASLVKNAVEAAAQFGLDGLEDARVGEDTDMHNRRLYIGSFAVDDKAAIVPITSDLLKRVSSPSFGERDLDALLKASN
jgi:hypothetical protein